MHPRRDAPEDSEDQAEGRASAVWFNQSSMFTVSPEMGEDGSVSNWEEIIAEGYHVFPFDP